MNSTIDKFINLNFKEHKKTRYNGTKQANDLGNYGGNIGSKYYVNRNGEYNGIVIELCEKILPLYLSNSIHQMYMCIESDYINVKNHIEKYNLEKLYQKYSNELIRFIVDEYLCINNLEPFYSNYPKINLELKKNLDSDLVELKKN